MKLYSKEIEDGLSDVISGNTSIAYCVSAQPGDFKVDLDLCTAGFEIPETIDLYPIKTILATTGWNKNQDIFLPEEMWAARNTPCDKPLNIGHDPSKIRGHIIGCYPMDFDNELLDNKAEQAPDKFHLVTTAVIYKIWKRNQEIQNEIDNILAEIHSGTWFVSMEALFDSFDYGMRSADGKQFIVPRNESSAFLTKYLGAYGGPGVYETYRIGRILRNVIFSGKGLVKNPANEYSIILAENFNGSLKEIGEIMDNKNPELEASLAKVAELEGVIATLNSELEKYKTQESTLAGENQNLKTQLDETIAKVKELESKVLSFEVAAKTAKRKAMVTCKGKTEAEAEEFLTKFGKLDDESFEAVVSLLKVETVAEAKDVSEIPNEELKETIKEAPLTTSASVAEEAVASIREYIKLIYKETK